MSNDHDARITATEDDLDDTRAAVHVCSRRLDDLDRRLAEVEAVLRRILQRS
jgi:hypothetical protein